MSAIIDQASLFNGCNYAPMIQNEIYKDILYTRLFFPDIYPYQYRYPGYATVLLQGRVQIRIHGKDCALPLSMAIPPSFPNDPPITQIAVQKGFPLNTSKSLKSDGLVVSEEFFHWVPGKSTICQFIREIVKHFSSKPPFSLENGKNLVPNALHTSSAQSDKKEKNQNPYHCSEIQEQAIVEAVSLLESINNDIQKNEMQYCEDMLTVDMTETILTIFKGLQNYIEQNKKKLNELESQQLPDVQIDPTLENTVKMNSKKSVFENCKNELQRWYEDGTISLDDFLQAIRDLSRDHFQNDILSFS